jgi:hypothetical protein
MTGLPPWSGDHVAMLRWLEPELNAKLSATLATHAVASEAKTMTPLELAMLAASRGNVEPLRRHLVELTGDVEVARFINLPKLQRGERWRPARIRKRKQTVQPPQIAEWAILIREIWREHFGALKRRSPDWSAEDFAFAIYIKDAGVEGFDLTEREPYTDEKRWTDRAIAQVKRGKKPSN